MKRDRVSPEAAAVIVAADRAVDLLEVRYLSKSWRSEFPEFARLVESVRALRKRREKEIEALA